MVWRDSVSVDFEFALRGELHLLKLPDEDSQQVRKDELWQTTCFEAFLRPSGGMSYFELNMAPSTAWASYRFDSYRSGMKSAAIEPAQPVWIMCDGSIWEQHISFDVARVSELNGAELWEIGLSAIIEEKSGKKSYWALSHPDGPPDFHDPTCFVATLPTIG